MYSGKQRDQRSTSVWLLAVAVNKPGTFVRVRAPRLRGMSFVSTVSTFHQSWTQSFSVSTQRNHLSFRCKECCHWTKDKLFVTRPLTRCSASDQSQGPPRTRRLSSNLRRNTSPVFAKDECAHQHRQLKLRVFSSGPIFRNKMLRSFDHFFIPRSTANFGGSPESHLSDPQKWFRSFLARYNQQQIFSFSMFIFLFFAKLRLPVLFGGPFPSDRPLCRPPLTAVEDSVAALAR